jgi:predicted N-acetyltransferase YhbS
MAWPLILGAVGRGGFNAAPISLLRASVAFPKGKKMSVALRPATAGDAQACGRVIYDAFRSIARAHGFPPDFPSPEVGLQAASLCTADPSVFGVVAEEYGQVIGSNFLTEDDPVRAVGPISVVPDFQGGGIARLLIEAVLDCAKGAAGVRLVGDTFNTRSVALYAPLGFEIKELLLLMCGAVRGKATPGHTVRPMVAGDISACAALCTAVHGVERTAELRNALSPFTSFVVERDNHITGYLSAPTFWVMNHGVAETEADMRALIAGAAAASTQEFSLLLPVRRAHLFRWCLEQGLRVVKPMTLMALGQYQEPRRCLFPSVFY